MKVSALLVLPLLLISATAYSNDKIAEYAVSEYTPKDYPKLYAKFGDGGFKKINQLAPEVAKKASESSECDRVEIVEVSDSRSIPGSEIVFFADCANGARFFISEKDVVVGTSVQSQTAKMNVFNDEQAVEGCQDAIKTQLKNALTFDRKAGSTSVYRAPSTGNIVVTFDFTAKNDFGAEMRYKAKCVITDKGIEDALISN